MTNPRYPFFRCQRDKTKTNAVNPKNNFSSFQTFITIRRYFYTNQPQHLVLKVQFTRKISEIGSCQIQQTSNSNYKARLLETEDFRMSNQQKKKNINTADFLTHLMIIHKKSRNVFFFNKRLTFLYRAIYFIYIHLCMYIL